MKYIMFSTYLIYIGGLFAYITHLLWYKRFRKNKNSRFMHQNGAILTIEGEIHEYSQKDVEHFEKLIKQHDILIYEGKTYEEGCSSNYFSESLMSSIHGLIRKIIKPLFMVTKRNNNHDFYDIAEKHNKEILGLEPVGRGIPIIVAINFLLVVITLGLYIVIFCLFTIPQIYTDIYLTYISLSMLIFFYFLIIKRNRSMAQRIIDLLQTHPQKKILSVFGHGHFPGVARQLGKKLKK